MNNVLVIGDSWASAVVAGNPAHGGWPQILDIPAEMRQAVAGSTAAQWAADFEGRMAKAVATKADKVIVSLLGNDVMAAYADGVVSPDELLALLKNYATILSALEPWERKVYVLGYADPFCGRDLKASIAVMLLNSAISLGCPNNNMTFIGVADVLKPEHFDGVDIHPNLAGHEAIARKVAEVVK